MESCSHMQESEQDHDVSEHDKISSQDRNENNCEGFKDFLEMLEQDKEVVGSGDSEIQELGDKITFYPKSSENQAKFEESK